MNSCEKGKRGEREARDELRAHGYEARRGQQRAGGPDSPDVISSLPIHWEVKRTERVSLKDWIVQASTDAQGKTWAILHKWNFGPWLVIFPTETFFAAVRGDFAGVQRNTEEHTQRRD